MMTVRGHVPQEVRVSEVDSRVGPFERGTTEDGRDEWGDLETRRGPWT